MSFAGSVSTVNCSAEALGKGRIGYLTCCCYLAEADIWRSLTNFYNTIRLWLCIPRNSLFLCNFVIDTHTAYIFAQNHGLNTRTETIAPQRTL